MGFIKAAAGAAGGVLADEWRDFFYCEALDEDTLMAKGEKRVYKRSSNVKNTDNIISDGSIVAIADGQCMIVVEQGAIIDVVAEPGEYVYDTGSEPSIFYGSLDEGVVKSFQQMGKRFGFGGQPGQDQRIYFFNTKEIYGNKYGTASPVPFRVVDTNIGLDVDISVRCSGEYSYKLADPIFFYKNVAGNVEGDAMRDAANNEGGAMNGFIGMGMAGAVGGMNAGSLFQQGQQGEGQVPPRGYPMDASGGFGADASDAGFKNTWTCTCGASNTGKFCSECGKPRQHVTACAKCGWTPDAGIVPSKFCPDCGNPLD